MDTLTVLADGASVRSALPRLSAAGIVREVP
jgi:hypothetical protein